MAATTNKLLTDVPCCSYCVVGVCCFRVRADTDQILEIENGRGIGANDHDLMRKRLEEQGVQDIASVSLHEQ